MQERKAAEMVASCCRALNSRGLGRCEPCLCAHKTVLEPVAQCYVCARSGWRRPARWPPNWVRVFVAVCFLPGCCFSLRMCFSRGVCTDQLVASSYSRALLIAPRPKDRGVKERESRAVRYL